MSRKKTINFEFEEVFERIRKKTGIKNFVQLAEIIDVTQQAISLNKKKNIFPLEWAYIVSEKFKLELNWLLKGQESKERKIQQESRENSLLDEIDNWLTVKAEKEPEIIDWFTYEILKKFPEFAEWKRKADKEREDSFSQQQNVA